jgi:hypothetical protein
MLGLRCLGRLWRVIDGIRLCVLIRGFLEVKGCGRWYVKDDSLLCNI